MDNDLEILIKRIVTSEIFLSQPMQSEKIVRLTLQQAYDELERRFGEQTAVLLSANRQLQEEIAEHTSMEYALYYRAEFERLILEISTNFIKPSHVRIHRAIRDALQRIGKVLGVDHGYVLLFSRDKKKIEDIYEWCDKGIRPQIKDLRAHLVHQELPWLVKRIKRHGVIYAPSLNCLPSEAGAEKTYFHSLGVQSFIAVPIPCGKSCIGCLGFDSVRNQKTWTLDIIVLLRGVGEILANALDHHCSRKNIPVRYRKNPHHASHMFQVKRSISIPLIHRRVEFSFGLKKSS